MPEDEDISRSKFRRRIRRVAVVVGIVLTVWLAVSFAIAYRLTHRPRPRFEERPPHVSWGQLEEHRLETSDGEKIGAWFWSGRDHSPIVILLHGNKGSRWNSLMRGELFASHGFGVLMISLRAHGDSTGDFHDLGLSARRDVVAAVDFLEENQPGRPIVVMGTSLGSAAAVFAAGELGHRVRGYILESPYQDLKTAVWNRTDTYLPPVLSHCGYLGLRVVGPLLLPNLDQNSPLEAIAAIPDDIPVLILAGAADRLARPAEARALFDRVASHGKLVIFPGADHHNLPETAPEVFKGTVVEFCGQFRQVTRANAVQKRAVPGSPGSRHKAGYSL